MRRRYLIAVVCHWLSYAGQNEQLFTLHCSSYNIFQSVWFKMKWMKWKLRLCVSSSLDELIKWRSTAREPILLRSLLFSSFCRTNITSRSGKEFTERTAHGEVECDKQKLVTVNIVYWGDLVWQTHAWSHYPGELICIWSINVQNWTLHLHQGSKRNRSCIPSKLKQRRISLWFLTVGGSL